MEEREREGELIGQLDGRRLVLVVGKGKRERYWRYGPLVRHIQGR